MNKITLNGKRYIALGEFDRIRRNMIQDIYANYKPDETGKINMSDSDYGAVKALSNLMTIIIDEELSEVGTDSEKRNKVYYDVRNEALRNNWYLAIKDHHTGRNYYFRKWCDCVGADTDEPTPVLSELKRDAMIFTDYYMAHLTASRIKTKCPEADIKIEPAVYLSEDAERRLLEAIFGTKESCDATNN